MEEIRATREVVNFRNRKQRGIGRFLRSLVQMKTVTMPVKGLNFAGCAREIEKNLSKLDGIAQVDASYVSQTVTVTYDENKLSDTKLRGLITDCGFLCGAPWSETSNP